MSLSKIDLANLAAAFDGGLDRFMVEWRELLAIKSISADPKYDSDCVACAAWLTHHLAKLGLSTELLETRTKPVVFAQYAPGYTKRSVLFYGHYDVQPVDPLELWHTPPFSPEFREGRIYARGAQDNKGQLFSFLKALEVLIQAGAPICNVKVLLEGEEECGSGGMRAALPEWLSKIAADLLMVCDTDMAAPGVPAVVMGLRGLVGCTVRLGGLKRDLHSGLHGGIAPNPALEIAKLAAGLHREDGSVAVPGFYDGLLSPTAKELVWLEALPFDPLRYKEEVGVNALGGEKGYAHKERLGFRPTLEVNGIHAGYDGPGLKTIIPANATLKLTARLAAGQEPQKTLDLILSHIRKHAPAYLQLEFSDLEVAGPAVRCDPDGPGVRIARKVLQEIFGVEPVFEWSGASIPVVAELAGLMREGALLVGFGQEDNNIHAPNENFSLDQFRNAFLYNALILQALEQSNSE